MASLDTKTFFKYLWHNQVKPSNWIRSSTFYEYIMMFTTLYAVIFSGISLQRKAIIFMGFLIGITIIKLYALFKSGAHRGWNRENYGIYTKAQLKKYKLNKKRKLGQ